MTDAEDARRFRFIRDNYAAVAAPKMDSQHVWRFRSGLPALIGPDFETAVDRAIEAVEKSKEPA